MKRIITIIAMITMSVIMQAQTSLVSNPTIQDTFFGLKMESKVTSSQIKKAVGSKGLFDKESCNSNSVLNEYVDTYFAGEMWDYANFFTTSDGTFYRFSVYNSYNDYDIDDMKEANKLYKFLKEKLDEKYGVGEENKDNEGNLCTMYYGSNGMNVIISNERSRSLGGSYRWYVDIDYISTDTYLKQNAANNDEL